ncbi:MAG: response regulator [Bacteroidetes bacterium]|nr:response regulator [Bacteroidota bacterium]
MAYFNSVLIVDDSEIDVLVNRRLMELTNFASNIAVAGTGEEGLRYLQEECANAGNAPDYIFLDIHLPMMSGYDFMEAFKSLPSYITEKTKIIVLSVFQKPDHLRVLSQNAAVIGQVEKPLTQQVLKELGETHKLPASASF